MPELQWLEAPAWIMALALALWLVVRSVGWGLQIKQGTAHPQPARYSNGESAEWRGETRQVLKQLRSVLKESSALDRETLEVLKDVRDELHAHNTDAHERHKVVREIYKVVMDREG